MPRKARVIPPWDADVNMTVTHINGEKVSPFTISRVTQKRDREYKPRYVRTWSLWRKPDNYRECVLYATDTITVLE